MGNDGKGTWEGEVTSKILNLETAMHDVKECLDHHGKTLQQINITMLDVRDKWQESHDSQLRIEGKMESVCLKADNAVEVVKEHKKEHMWATLKDFTKIGVTLSSLPILGAFFAWLFKFWPFSEFR